MINLNLYNRTGSYFEGSKSMVDCLIMALILSSSDALESIRLPVYEQQKIKNHLTLLLHQHDDTQLSCVTMKYQSLTSNDLGTSPKFSKISGPLIISFTSKGSWGLVTGTSMGFLTCCSIKMSLLTSHMYHTLLNF